MLQAVDVKKKIREIERNKSKLDNDFIYVSFLI